MNMWTNTFLKNKVCLQVFLLNNCARGETDIINAFEAFVPSSNLGGRAQK